MHLQNFRDRLYMENRMISHGKVEIGFMLFCLFYVITIYLNFKWPVPVDISSDLLAGIKTTKTFDSMLELIQSEPQRLKPFELFGQDRATVTVTSNPNSTDGPDVHVKAMKPLKRPVLALLPMIVIHRGKPLDRCGPPTARELSQRFPAYMKCRLFLAGHSGVNSTNSDRVFNVSRDNCAVDGNLPRVLQNCVGSDSADEAPPEVSKQFSNHFWVKMKHFASPWPWEHSERHVDVFPYAPPDQIPTIASDFINHDLVAHSVTRVEIRRVFYYHLDDPNHGVVFVYVETSFEVRDTNYVYPRYQAETVENMKAVPVTLLLAVLFAAIDGGVQVMMILSNIRRERGRRLMHELNQLAKLSGSVGHVYSYGNLASDVTIMALGIFRMVVVANDWMERSVSDLLLNDDVRTLRPFLPDLDPLTDAGVRSYVDKYDKMRETIYWIRLVRRVEIVLFMVIIFRLVKFPAGHPKVAALIRTISLARDELVHFFLLFFSFQAALLVAALMCFGDTAERFSSPLELMYLQFQLLTGEWPFEDFEEPMLQRTTAMSLWMTTYGLVVFFTLINFFIAIISRAFGEAQGELERFPVAQQFITDVFHLILTSATSWLGLKRTFSYDYGGAHYRQEDPTFHLERLQDELIVTHLKRTESYGGLRGGDNIVLEQHQDDEGHQQLEAVNVHWERRAHADLIPQHDRLHMEAMTVSAREIINQIREKRYIRGFDDDGMQDMFMHYMKLYGRQPHQFLHRDFQLPERDPIFDLHTVVQAFSKSIDTTLTVGFRRTIALLKDLRQSELDCVSKAREMEQLLPAMETARCASEQLERKVFGRPLRDDEDAGELLAQRRSRLRDMTNRLNAHVMSTASMLDQYLPPPDWRQRLATQGKTVSGGGRGDAVMQKRRAEEQKKRQLEALIAYRARKAPPKAPSMAMNPDTGREGAGSTAQIAGAKSRPVVKGAKLKAPPYKKASPSEIRRMLEEAKRNRQR
ncbi:hypothetical protein FOZ62_023965 [Perkinsus olseni]|uniref:Polycystin cation channel PKD1/PKD2 domain-containing protein n=1 Tax=Perkinsus olseni TaxID=32597 RepID=A0A7J6N1C3_PEROL|nr:hypothetical protein FOZ62_023965 [Perkinsus olseni]